MALLILGLPAQARYGGGNGTPGYPYLIATAEQMNTVGLNPEDWDKHFRLVADIDMNDVTGAAVSLIGTFQGVFDGDGHTIANLTYVITAAHQSWPGRCSPGSRKRMGRHSRLFGAENIELHVWTFFLQKGIMVVPLTRR